MNDWSQPSTETIKTLVECKETDTWQDISQIIRKHVNRSSHLIRCLELTLRLLFQGVFFVAWILLSLWECHFYCSSGWRLFSSLMAFQTGFTPSTADTVENSGFMEWLARALFQYWLLFFGDKNQLKSIRLQRKCSLPYWGNFSQWLLQSNCQPSRTTTQESRWKILNRNAKTSMIFV